MKRKAIAMGLIPVVAFVNVSMLIMPRMLLNTTQQLWVDVWYRGFWKGE